MIRSEDFHQGHDGTDRGGGQVVGFPELDALNALVDEFAREMKRKLHEKYFAGFSGWDDPDLRPLIEERLSEHMRRGSGQYVDVANLAAMLWNFDN